ncbi:hypothetical protein vB_RpoS-V16_54 [Ruegeria phage vB_RpoS-V16]|uniref:major tail protein with Ig-like domain n=1 Tax=Ruegeria phage vB_RpoS-V16 TaxID=2218618 RepID=UPI000DCAAF3A|nr:major tail protein with Ig-like domain [Ruegeria phage vB_RpoS-V16]AWY09490.1 hypothetical protein vB_RpoS-V16_54 [Ruegeria phage vB_RpoS-V16]
MPNNLVLGRGKLYFDRFATGTLTKTGERYLGSTPAFSVSAETQELDHFSSEEGLQIKDESVTLRIDYSATLTVENIDAANLALFFFGTSETATIAAAPAQTDNVTVLQGMFYQLGMTPAKPEGVENVSNVVVTGSGGAPAYVAGTDYNVDLTLGRVEIIAGGGIADDTAIEIDYDVAAQTQERVVSGSSLIQGALRFISYNGVGGQRNFYMPKVTMRPNGEFALKGEEWQNMGFNIEILQAGSLANVFATGRGVV